MKLSTTLTLIAVVISVLVCCGCKKKLPSLAEMNDSNIRRLHSAYSIYLKRNGYTGPKDEKELKTYLQENRTAKALLGRMGIKSDSLDDIFVSERDGKRFKIRWGVQGLADHAIVFEAEGVDGKRMVAFSRPRELESQEYEGYWTGELKGARPGGRGGDQRAGQPNQPGNPTD